MKERRSDAPLVNGITPPPVSVPFLPTDDQLARIEDMSRDELITLARRCNAALGGVGVLSEDETAEALLLKISAHALSGRGIDWLSSAREWFDRKRGKATQRIEQKIDHTSKHLIVDMTSEQIMLELQRMQTLGVMPDGVKVIEGRVEVIGEVEQS